MRSKTGETDSSKHIVMCRRGQNYIYAMYVRYFWQGNHQIYAEMVIHGAYIRFRPTPGVCTDLVPYAEQLTNYHLMLLSTVLYCVC